MKTPLAEVPTQLDTHVPQSWWPIWKHAMLRVRTGEAVEFVDITDQLGAFLRTTGVSVGLVNVQAIHTTTGVVINENEPLLLRDFRETLHKAAPPDGVYQHDDVRLRTVNLTTDERINGHAHCQALLLGATACLNVVNGVL